MKKMLLATLAAMTGFLSIRLSANAHPNKSTKPEGTLPKPNIVYIIADDLGWKDVAASGTLATPIRSIGRGSAVSTTSTGRSSAKSIISRTRPKVS